MADPGPKCRNCGEHAADHDSFGKCRMPEGAPANWTRHTFEPELVLTFQPTTAQVYVPPGTDAVVAPGVTVWSADEGGLFVRHDPSALPNEEDVLSRVEKWLYETFGDDDERGVPALAEELLRVVDGTQQYVCEHCGLVGNHRPNCPEA